MLGGLSGYLLAVGAAIVGLVGIIIKSRMDGARLDRAKRQEEELRARDIRDQVQNDVGVLTAAEARKELGEWSK